MEKLRRSVAKAISWRFVATVITSLIVWALTGRLEFALTVGLLDTSIKIFVYIAHERAWNRIDFGRHKPNEQDYQI